MKLGKLAGILNRTTACLPITLMLFYASSLMASHGLHTNFIKKDGSFWSAGNNLKGQLGDGTTTDRYSPVQALFGGVIAVSSGEYHTMFIKKDFTLWGIGQNGNGQLGDGSTTDRSTPVQITSNVHSVSCGYQHTIFLKRDGSLWGMGGNHIGQLGDATGNDHHSPVQIESSGVVFIAAGGYNTYYIKSNGSLWGTGYNQHGPIGDGTTTHVTTPYQIKPSGVKQVSAGAQHSAFLMKDGSLWTSGGNAEGQLGNGTTSGRQTHAQVIASGIKSISLGWYTTFFIKDDDSLWAAGLNSLGRLGDGTTTNRSTPVQIISSSVSQVSTGLEHSTVLKTDGSVWTFGENSDGRLGIGNTSNASSPTEITGFNGVHRLADVVPNHLVELNSSVDLEMIWVQPGTFTMGSPVTEAGRETDETEHNVILTKGFYLGKYEVTQAQYEAVMTGNPNGLNPIPSNWPNNPNRPVENVSWDDIQIFLTRLNSNEQAAGRLQTGWSYILPSEAQWEYACRAGTTTAYSWGNTITADNANFLTSGYSQTRDVGLYDANPWGFFDMNGNAFEWIADWKHTSYSSTPQIDPMGPSTGTNRVTRGGSFGNAGTSLRSAYRSNYSPINRHSTLGFRVAFQQINTPPTDLNSTSPLSIAENQPLGTIIGEFNATDSEVQASINSMRAQVEKITIGGNIADGDRFQLQLNELSSIREIEYTTPVIEYVAGTSGSGSDESLALTANPDGVVDSGDEVFDQQHVRTKVRDELVLKINAAAAQGANGQFVTASADPSDDNSILIVSQSVGDPFELFNVSSSNDAVSFDEEATPTTPNIANDAEEAIIQIDLKDNAQNTGLSLRAGDSVTVHIKDASGNLQPFTYTVGTSDLTDAIFSSNAGTDPQNEWLAASTFLLNGLANTITNEKVGKNVKVDAGVPMTWYDGVVRGSQLILRSEERGVPLDIVFNNDDTDGVVNLSLTRPAQTATASTLVVNLPRDVKEGDTFRLSGMADGTDSAHMFDQADFTATYSHGDNYVLGGTTKTISDRATLAEAISTHADIASATIAAGNNLTITANINAVDDQPKLSFGQEGVDGELLGVPGTQTRAAVGKTVYNGVQTRVSRNGGGFSAQADLALNVTLNTDGTNKGHVSTAVDTANNGSNIAVGDIVQVLGSQLSGENFSNNYRYNVTAIQNGQVTDVSYVSTSSALVDAIATNIGTSDGGRCWTYARYSSKWDYGYGYSQYCG